jgi:ABC-type Fe3+-citrate transport system substrate-binding protein
MICTLSAICFAGRIKILFFSHYYYYRQLNKVNPGSAAFSEIDNFIAEINKKIDNNITRDWLDKQQEKKDALEKEKYKMEIEKSQIEAAKQIAIAYASGTYITNNYSTSNYSTSYSSPYYTVRIYDTLIW